MFNTNRYDNLQAKAKKLRLKIEKRTQKATIQNKKIEEKITDLRTKSREVSYKKNVYCETINNKLKDVNSLIRNEQERISNDMVTGE